MQIDAPEYITTFQTINNKMMEIQQYIISHIDNNQSIEFLPEILQQANFLNEKSIFHDFLCFLNSISYSRVKSNQKDNIHEIILYLKDKIIQTFTENEICSIFCSNSPIFLFLYENKFIQYEQICNRRNFVFDNYFLSEKVEHQNQIIPNPMFSSQDEIYYINHLEEFRKNRKEYHSESIIAQYIRSDDIESFINYVSRSDMSLYSNIPQSIFESDFNLRYNLHSMIEYAAAFGALNIFKFLYSQLQVFPPEILKAAIIGGNPEIIHLLEDKGFIPNLFMLAETVKYHRNDVFDYFVTNYAFETDFDLFIDSIDSFNYFAMNEILRLHPEYLTNNEYLNKIFYDVCAVDCRIWFDILISLPAIDINYKNDEKDTDQVSIVFLNEILLYCIQIIILLCIELLVIINYTLLALF